jgi:hypothetical protein
MMLEKTSTIPTVKGGHPALAGKRMAGMQGWGIELNITLTLGFISQADP